jgi:hypothetical protein
MIESQIFKRGNLDPLHAVIGRRLWNFKSSGELSTWLKSHYNLAKTHSTAPLFKNLARLTPNEMRSFFGFLGLDIKILEQKQYKKYRDPELLSDLLREIPSARTNLMNTTIFRRWLRKQLFRIKVADKEELTRKDRVIRRRYLNSDGFAYRWDSLESMRAELDALQKSNEERTHMRQLGDDLPFLTNDTVRIIAQHMGVKLRDTSFDASNIPFHIRQMIASEVKASYRAPTTTEEARHLLSRVGQIYDPKFLSTFRRLTQLNPVTIRGGMGLPRFVKHKIERTVQKPQRKTRLFNKESKDKGFQTAKLRMKLADNLHDSEETELLSVTKRARPEIDERMKPEINWEINRRKQKMLRRMQKEQLLRERPEINLLADTGVQEERPEKITEPAIPSLKGHIGLRINKSQKNLVWRKPGKRNIIADAKVEWEAKRRQQKKYRLMEKEKLLRKRPE